MKEHDSGRYGESVQRSSEILKISNGVVRECICESAETQFSVVTLLQTISYISATRRNSVSRNLRIR